VDFLELLKKVASFAGILLMSFSVGAYATEQSSGRHICVVAVHDSSLFTLCPPSLRRALADGGLKNLPPPTSTWYDSNANRFDLNGYEMRIEWDGRLWIPQVQRGPGFPAVVRPFDLRNHPAFMVVVPPPLLAQDPGILERSRPDWKELSQLVTDVSPSGWMDPGMAKEIESEFRKRKDYLLVDSA
jgi:hypothetical protein